MTKFSKAMQIIMLIGVAASPAIAAKRVKPMAKPAVAKPAVAAPVAKPAATAAVAAPAATPAATTPAAKPAYTTADTDIGTLIDTPATRAIVDKILPGFSTNPQIDMGRAMTLRAVQQFVPDVLTTEKLNALDAEFAKLPAK